MDDIVQTILLNMFFNSEISAMSPKQELFGGQLTVIRPLAYAEEREIVRFAQAGRLPKSKPPEYSPAKLRKEAHWQLQTV